MITPPSGTRIWLAAGIPDMRRGMEIKQSQTHVANGQLSRVHLSVTG
jgi:hypothetical protein